MLTNPNDAFICLSPRPRPRLVDDPRPRLSFLSSRRLETKTLVSRTTSLIKCTKFGQLILRKIIKIVVSSAGGGYSAPSDPLAGFKGPTSRGREGRGDEGKKG